MVSSPQELYTLNDQPDWQGLSSIGLATSKVDWAWQLATLSGIRRARVPTSNPRFVVSGVNDEEFTWVEPVLTRVSHLISLRENWDSYGSSEIDLTKALFGVRLLFSLLGPTAPAPEVVPSTSGGLQFEWHANGLDLEIEVVTAGRINVFFEDTSTGLQREATLTSDFRPLTEMIDKLS